MKSVTKKINDAYARDIALANFKSGLIRISGSSDDINSTECSPAMIHLPSSKEGQGVATDNALQSLKVLGITPEHFAAIGHAFFTDKDRDKMTSDTITDLYQDTEEEDFLLSPQGAKILIEAGVEHPVLEAIAKHEKIHTFSQHSNRIKK